jgi:hypothetical protein
MITIKTLSLLVYFYRYSYLDLGEHTMVLPNLLDDRPSCIGPLLGPSESMQGSTPGTNPHQQPPSA